MSEESELPELLELLELLELSEIEEMHFLKDIYFLILVSIGLMQNSTRHLMRYQKLPVLHLRHILIIHYLIGI